MSVFSMYGAGVSLSAPVTTAPSTSCTTSASHGTSWTGRPVQTAATPLYTGNVRQAPLATTTTMTTSLTSTWTKLWPTISSTATPASTSSTSSTCVASNAYGSGQYHQHDQVVESKSKSNRGALAGPGPAPTSSINSGPASSSALQPASADFTAQLLQFVGLPTNLAGQLAPQKFEQKRRVRQKALNIPNVSSSSSHPHGVTKSPVKNNMNYTPLIPKPGAPLPANLADDLPGILSSDAKIRNTNSFVSSSREQFKETNLGPPNVSEMLTPISSVNSSAKRMSLQDYKTREEANKCSNLTQDYTNIAVNNNSAILSPETDKDGFVIPNAITAISKFNPGNNANTRSVPYSERDKEESVIPTNDSPVADCNVKVSSDEMDTSLDELVIDEATATDKISSPVVDEERQSGEEEYQRKSKEDISEISMDLDELYNNLTTDGTLLMDRKMRKKLKKLLKKQKRRAERTSVSKEGNIQYPDGVKHNRHCATDEEDFEYSDLEHSETISDVFNAEEENSQKDSPKFKSVKHKHIVRKYRQREQEEEKRCKKQSGREPRSEGELSEEGQDTHSEGELSEDTSGNDNDDKSDSEEVRKRKGSSDWVEEMPHSPNDLQITFTVQLKRDTSIKLKSGNKLKKTIAERSGGFRGKEHGSIFDALIFNSSKDEKGPNHNISVTKKSQKSPEVIQIFDKESFLEVDDSLDKKLPEEEGLLSDSSDNYEADFEKHRQSSRSRQKYKRHSRRKRPTNYGDRHSRSRSRSPYKDHKEKRRNKHSKSRSRSRSQSPFYRSGERKHRKSRSRSRSQEKIRIHHRRRHRRSRSRSRSRSQSPITHKRSRSRSPRGYRHKYSQQRKRHSRSRTRSPHTESRERDTHQKIKVAVEKKEQPKMGNHQSESRSRSRSPSLVLEDSQPVQEKPMINLDTDCNFDDYNMEISSGGESPPLTIVAERPATNESPEEDANVSKQLEEAMERLKKMEKDVSRRQMMIQELESKTLEDDSKSVEPRGESVAATEDGEDEMDEQLLDAVQRLQKMEENYSRRQMLLDNLRKSMLDAEKELNSDMVEDQDNSPDKKLEIQNKKMTRKDVPQRPSSSSTTKPPPQAPTPVPPPAPPSPPPPPPPKTSSTGNQPKSSAPSVSSQSVPSISGVSKNSRWDKTKQALTAKPSAPVRPTGAPPNKPAALGKRIPSILDVTPFQPHAQRPPWNGNRPLHPGHMPMRPPGQRPVMRPPANRFGTPFPRGLPPAAAARGGPVDSDHQLVWLVGSSVLCQAARYVAQGPVGLGLMLTQAELVWHGHDNLKWCEFGPLLTRLIGNTNAPSVLLVHMDALELATVSFQDLAQQAVESMLEFDRRHPKCRIIWSETLPCCHYPGTIAQMTMEQVRINYNVMCSKLVLSLGGQVIKHSAIRPETPALFDSDKMHLSDLGNNIFLNNLRRGLAFLLSEPSTKIYCASDDRTF